MGALGGVLVGSSGLGSLDGARFLGGLGIGGSPSISNADIFYDFTNGVPTTDGGALRIGSAMVARNGQLFQKVDNFTEEVTPFSVPVNGDKTGMWNDADIVDGSTEFDIVLTFAFTPAADTIGGRMGPAMFDVDASVDGLSPFNDFPNLDRNSDRIFPNRFGTEDQVGSIKHVGGVSTAALTGDQLIADGVTLHKFGWQVYDRTGSIRNWRTYFDGTLLGQFDLTSDEALQLDTCTRIGFHYDAVGFSETCFRIRLLEFGSLGSLLPPPP